MRDSLKIALGIIVGVLALAGVAAICLFCIAGFVLSRIPYISTPTPVSVGIVPTAAPQNLASTPTVNEFGQSVVSQNIKTTVIEYQFSAAYKNKQGTDTKPPDKAKFLWLHISAENVGQVASDTPTELRFRLIYKGTEVYAKFYFDDRSGYSQYRSSRIFPGVRADGWILFEIPQDARPEDAQVRLNTSDNIYAPVYFLWQLR